MTGLAGRSSGLGPTAQQVSEGDAWAVEVDLNPVAADLLLDLARVLQRKELLARQFDCLRLRGLGAGLRGELLAVITADPDVQAALRIALHPDAAGRLSSELYDSLTEPDTCRWGQGCGSYVGTDLLYCDRHREIADGVSERIARAR